MSPRLSPSARAIAIAFAACLGLNRCMTGSEIPNEISGTMVDAAGQTQAGVLVALFRSDLVPGQAATADPVASVTTDAKGQYAFLNIQPGGYNVLASKSGSRAYRDSLYLNAGRVYAGSDTLKTPGVLAGRIKLEPMDSPRLALVQVIGTHIFVNVDSAGWFALTDMAEGRYRIRIFVADSNYVPEFRVVGIRSGKTDTLPEVIEPFYIGPPRISGMQAQALPDGVIRISWNRSRARQPFTYAIFREENDTPFMSGNAMNYLLTDTVYLDTVYSRTPRPDPFGFQPNSGVYAGQYPYEDTTAYKFRYRLMIFNAGGEEVATSDYARAIAIPPAAK